LFSVSVLLNQGDGTFAAPIDHFIHGDTITALAAADLNGDGKPDLAVIGGNTLQVLMNHGDGTFAAPVGYAGWGDAIAAADLNGDGRLDLALAGSPVPNDVPAPAVVPYGVNVLLNTCLP